MKPAMPAIVNARMKLSPLDGVVFVALDFMLPVWRSWRLKLA
jgi:hypothetical protein